MLALLPIASAASAQAGPPEPEVARPAAPKPSVTRNVGAELDTLAGVLTAQGYKADVASERDGMPHIFSSAAGSPFAVILMGCTENRACSTVQFYADYAAAGATLESLNGWNAANRFARAYLDPAGKAVIEMDVNLAKGGVARDNLADSVDEWIRLMAAFERHIGA
ncbi:YbjN domain-containing protein [Sphingomonas sanxanigenens]|uniref:YbjN domain-containing protein n=1 Tax=Sphingomonas sanxanigenens DSM 19645 = NX02 TaxID=1123269 RepID=W0AJA3_9SPHN|nr:YbjN domain-containing protein [Sphingomonas sanxanigenens]AHE56373.1 hypothetical protein NX02_23810 [Sphingomonas sanxanigenens DSM 19645 = NX02]